jgi:hypothetical protein
MDRTGHMLEGRYRLGPPLGEGGMATVHGGQDIKLGKAVAVKVLHAEFTGQPKIVQRFLQEARAISAVDHPNVVDVTDYGATPEGGVFLVMEMLHGEDLKAMLLREGPLPWARLGPMIMQICAALAAAHARGIVHRDVKPSNCFRDFIKVLDFGIAKVLGGDVRGVDSSSGVLLGTPEYMAPELAQGMEADARADIYAVGAMMYKLLTGTPPFVDEGYVAILTQHMFEPVEPPRRRAPDRDIPGDVEAVILRALAKDRGARQQTMVALAEAVAATLPGGPSVDRWLSGVAARPQALDSASTAELACEEEPAVERAPASEEVPSEVLAYADTRRVPRDPQRRRWPVGTLVLASIAALVVALVARSLVRRPAFDVAAAQAQIQGVAPALRACGEPVPLIVAVDASGAVTAVEPAPEAGAVDRATLACLRRILSAERFAASRGGSPFRAHYE